MDLKQIVNQFRRTIIDYAIPYGKITIAPYSNGHASGVTMFNGINVVDYISCNNQSAKDISKQVANELHVKYKRGLGF